MDRTINTHITNISFQNNHVVYENFTKCTIKDYEYNTSYNPTLLSGSQGILTPYSSSNTSNKVYITSEQNYGILKNFTTGSISGSEFSPYVASIGLYNDAQDLLAVAKMSTPIPIPSNTDMTFLVKWDTNFISKFISDNSDTVNIGGVNWTTRNLNVITYRNGDPIPEVTDPTEWANLTTGAWCYYDNNPVNGEIYGRLYNWYAVNDARGLAPVGYHIPSNDEYITLRDYLGGASIAGGKLKETGTIHWNTPNTGATNITGFTALPNGLRSPTTGIFSEINNYSDTWTSIESSGTNARKIYMSYNNSAFSTSTSNKKSGLAVRCIKD